MIRQLDTQALAQEFKTAEPFPSLCIEDLLEPDFAREVARSYPDFRTAEAMGFKFDAVNEKQKIQITDPVRFPDPVKRLAECLASQEFRDTLTQISGIPNLLWDDTYAGGGMHQTAVSGRLDVHVDFNRLPSSGLYRRLNLLLYLNEQWEEGWGGTLELWDREVKRCHRSFVPKLNRAVLFETSDISYHGVTRLTCPPNVERRSFAVYYYSVEPPTHALFGDHSTIFKARPDEALRRYVLMPAERLQRRLVEEYRRVRRTAGKALRSLR